jgi:hypothetical protein
MVVFRGSHVGVYDISAASVFEAATRPDLLGRWVTGNFANVRVDGAAPLAQASRFLADESLADGPEEKDHLYEVTRYETGLAFGLRCINGPDFVGELTLRPNGQQTQITWTFSASPAGRADRILATLLAPRIRHETQQQAAREVRRLVAVAKQAANLTTATEETTDAQ